MYYTFLKCTLNQITMITSISRTKLLFQKGKIILELNLERKVLIESFYGAGIQSLFYMLEYCCPESF